MPLNDPIADNAGIANRTGGGTKLAIAEPDQGHDSLFGCHRQHILAPKPILVPDCP